MHPSIRSLARIAMLGVALAALLFPQTGRTASLEAITQKERDFAAKYLDDTRAKFIASIQGLSDAQWKFKPAPERWSVAEVAEHLTVSEESILALVTERVMKTPEAKAPEGAASDEAVIKLVTDRSTKATAPEMLRPSGRWATRDDMEKEFLARRAKTISYIKETQDSLRLHSTPHPVLKSMDGYQWVILIAAHTARHTAQIEEVKADPNFPKK